MKTTAAIIIAVIVAAGAPATFAAEKKEPTHVQVDVKIPETAEALWTEIDSKYKALTDAVKAAKPDAKQVTELAETVEALVKAVPERTPSLAGDKKKRAEGQAKNVGRVLDEMHDAISEGKTDVGVKKLAQVDAALKIIRAQVK
jgi:hypothetical protein